MKNDININLRKIIKRAKNGQNLTIKGISDTSINVSCCTVEYIARLKLKGVSITLHCDTIEGISRMIINTL